MKKLPYVLEAPALGAFPFDEERKMEKEAALTIIRALRSVLCGPDPEAVEEWVNHACYHLDQAALAIEQANGGEH